MVRSRRCRDPDWSASMRSWPDPDNSSSATITRVPRGSVSSSKRSGKARDASHCAVSAHMRKGTSAGAATRVRRRSSLRPHPVAPPGFSRASSRGSRPRTALGSGAGHRLEQRRATQGAAVSVRSVRITAAPGAPAPNLPGAAVTVAARLTPYPLPQDRAAAVGAPPHSRHRSRSRRMQVTVALHVAGSRSQVQGVLPAASR